MASYYWDYCSANDTATTRIGPAWTSSSTSSDYLYVAYLPRVVLVDCPQRWTAEDVKAFVQLVNVKTSTGWQVQMVIRGDIAITDPTIEKRTMADFVPLLKLRATRTDLVTIEEFFKAHPF